jgi:sulfatase modifying factor 1
VRRVKTRTVSTSVAVCLAVASIASARSIDLVEVGDPGNAPDPANAADQPGIGAVGQAFRIGAFEVTNAEYAAFLNAVVPSAGNALDLYDTQMAFSNRGGIIVNAIAPAGLRYIVKPAFADKPVVFVSFLDAARYVNWLHNGRGPDGTEAGAYEIVDGLIDQRDPGARFFLPSDSEWYKAAYHHPVASGGPASSYWV